MEQGHQDDLELLKDMPGFKGILKAVLKSQMKHLVKQLSKYGDEEAMVLSASISDGSFHHLGSASTNGFLDSHDDIKSQFLGHCLKNDYELQDKAVEKNSSKSAETAQFSDTIMTEKQSESNVHPVAVTRVGDKSQKNSISQDRHIGPLEHVSEHQVKPALVLTRTADKGKPKAAQDRLIGPLVHVPEHKLKSLLPPQVHVEVPADSDLSIGRAGRKRPCETVTFTVTSDELVKHRTVTESASEIPKTASAAAKAKKRRVVNSGNVKFEIEATDLPAAQSIVSYDEGSRNILPLHPDTLGSETSDQSEMVQASKVDLSNSNNDSDTYDSVIVKIEPCDNDDDETAMDNSARGQLETSETETSQLEFKFDSTQADDVDKSDDSVKQSRDDSKKKDLSLDISIIKKRNQHSCDCGYGTTDRSNYNKHIKRCRFRSVLPSRAPVKISTHICDQCGKSFRSLYGLTLHVKNKHSLQFKYLCTTCGKTFNQSTQYRFHCSRHLKQTIDKCHHCNKEFWSHGSLKRHLEECEGTPGSTKPFKCDLCQASFMYDYRLEDHKKGKHQPPRYACDGCEKRYSWRSSLKAHKKHCRATTWAD